jgi:D-alanine transaminase
MIYLNGQFLPLEEAKISVLDRGFIFGDGVYEVIPVYSRRPFRLAGHLARLQTSLDAIQIENPCTPQKWGELIERVIKEHPSEDQAVYLQVTRGVARRDHTFVRGVPPTVFVMTNPLVTPSEEQVRDGVAAIVLPDFRWLRCDIKSTSLLGNCMLRTEASDRGCAEGILVREGFLTEASASNVFIVKDGAAITPPKSHLILPGITYDVVLELLHANGLPYEVRAVGEAELRGADEIWLTSSSREVIAVTTLDGRPVGALAHAGKPGPLFQQVHALYQSYKRTVMRAPAHA